MLNIHLFKISQVAFWLFYHKVWEVFGSNERETWPPESFELSIHGVFKPADHSFCCTRPPEQSWLTWERQGQEWGLWASPLAGLSTPLACRSNWRKSACVCGWCSSLPMDWASNSGPPGTSSPCTEWTGGTHWWSEWGCTKIEDPRGPFLS